ncbi:MAG: hypothetical protein HQL65_09440 [Magnetococcales bacterium]|nr:hypothetical protein [Magnetococcales bacterium]
MNIFQIMLLFLICVILVKPIYSENIKEFILYDTLVSEKLTVDGKKFDKNLSRLQIIDMISSLSEINYSQGKEKIIKCSDLWGVDGKILTEEYVNNSISSENYRLITKNTRTGISPCSKLARCLLVLGSAKGKKPEKSFLPDQPIHITPDLFSDKLIFPQYKDEILYNFTPPAKIWDALVKNRFLTNVSIKSSIKGNYLIYEYITYIKSVFHHVAIITDLLRSDFNGDGIEDVAFIMEFNKTPLLLGNHIYHRSILVNEREILYIFIGFATRLSSDSKLIPLKLYGDTNLYLVSKHDKKDDKPWWKKR